MQRPDPQQQLHDCLILGTGLGGSMLGAILARHGLDVLMIDLEPHPRFAIGEATTPDTNLRLRLLGEKFGVPEITNLSAFHSLRDEVSPACGIKRAFSFLYHEEGRPHVAQQSHQYPTLAPPMGPDCHFFRQDTDAYMMASAVAYGARVRVPARVTGIELGDAQVSVQTEQGETFRARYLVDATGMRSVLAQKLGLRDGSWKFQTDTRAIYTHMVGVKPWDQVGPGRREHGLKYPLSQSTLHHVFEGGWFWVIPFDNHSESTNPLCSVGLVLNRELHPETGRDPEEEFWSFVRKFPSMLPQFEHAQAVRKWVSTGRLQYGARSISGARYCLLAHAGFFIDPLYSTGLALSTATVDILAGMLLKSFREDDFSPERFEPLNRFFHANITYLDSVVAASFTSFRDYSLWDAWFRVWVVGLLIGTELNASVFLNYVETGDRRVLEKSAHEPHNGLLGVHFPEWRGVYTQALAAIEQVRAGSLEPRVAADRIRALFKGLAYVPTYFRWHTPEARSTPAFTLWGMTRMYAWYYLNTPRALRRRLYDWSAFTAYGVVFKELWQNSRAALGRRRRYVRDVFRAWNTDWKPTSAALNGGAAPGGAHAGMDLHAPQPAPASDGRRA